MHHVDVAKVAPLTTRADSAIHRNFRSTSHARAVVSARCGNCVTQISDVLLEAPECVCTADNCESDPGVVMGELGEAITPPPPPL